MSRIGRQSRELTSPAQPVQKSVGAHGSGVGAMLLEAAPDATLRCLKRRQVCCDHQLAARFERLALSTISVLRVLGTQPFHLR